jgi:hypothetical protein
MYVIRKEERRKKKKLNKEADNNPTRKSTFNHFYIENLRAGRTALV